jgi:hypothetical protein
MTGLPYYKTTGRRQLNQNVTYYVSKSGNDFKDGLTPSTAFLTFARLRQKLLSVDGNGSNINVQIGAGTWNEKLSIDRENLAETINIQGAGQTTIIQDSIEIENFSGVTLGNFKISDVNGYGLNVATSYVEITGPLWINNCTYGISFSSVATIFIIGAIDFSGNFSVVFIGSSSGILSARDTSSINFSNVNASSTSVYVIYNALLELLVPITGSATGTRYVATHGAEINTGGQGANAIPGTVAGITDTAGRYY